MSSRSTSDVWGTPLTRRRLGGGVGLGIAAAVGAGLGARPLMELADGRMRDLRLLVPNSPGSGYDMTAHVVGEVLDAARLTRGVEIFNIVGEAGVTGLHHLITEAGNDRLLASMGLGLLGGVIANQADSLLGETASIARLVSEPEAILVPANSVYRDLGDLVRDWKAHPSTVLVGGGSAPGGPDHLAPMLIAEYVGLIPKSVNYIAHDGRGRLMGSLLNNKVTFAVAGVGEFAHQLRTGEFRALAVAAYERVAGLDIPTTHEFGINIELFNWRGLIAPPGLSLTQRAALEGVIASLVATPQWKQHLAENNWQDAHLSAAQFHAFLNTEAARVRRVLGGLGVA